MLGLSVRFGVVRRRGHWARTATPTCGAALNPALVGFVPAVGSARDVAVNSATGRAYVASGEFGVSVVNVATPSAPVALGGCPAVVAQGAPIVRPITRSAFGSVPA